MTSRSNLTPTPTVDKNGRQTTVYRKQVAVTANATGVPAPALADTSVARRTELIRRVMSNFRIDRDTDDALMKMTRAVATYPVDLLEKLCDPDTASSDYYWMINAMVDDGGTAESVNEYLHFLPDVTEASLYVSQALVKSLHGYSQLPSSADYSRENEELRSQCSALLRFSNAARLAGLEVFKDDEFRFTLKDHAMVELILENHDSVGTLVAAVRERKSADPVMLDSVLKTDSPALGKGVL